MQDATPSIDDVEALSAQCNAYFMAKMGLSGYSTQSRFLALALCGEAGELANLVKKEWRDGPDTRRDQDISEEIADVQIYLWHLARARGVNIAEACAQKLDDLQQRWPDAFAAGECG